MFRARSVGSRIRGRVSTKDVTKRVIEKIPTSLVTFSGVDLSIIADFICRRTVCCSFVLRTRVNPI